MKLWYPVALALLVGCVSAAINSEEREYREAIDKENWGMCMAAYQRAGKPTYHFYHRGHGDPKPYQIKEDLVVNGCKRVLGRYWVEY